MFVVEVMIVFVIYFVCVFGFSLLMLESWSYFGDKCVN